MLSNSVLSVENLVTEFSVRGGTLRAVDDVTFSLARGEMTALVGESGCGKSATALSILRLLPIPPARIVSGRVEFAGQNLLELDEKHMRRVRGHKISMIFQEPMTSLNPVFTIGNQIAESIRLHHRKSRAEARALAVRLLERVGILSPAERVHSYPHQLSGGMRQRVMIAIALAGEPELLIADEPTTALDVTIQAQILDLLRSLGQQLSVLLITHDLGVVANTCQRAFVMYAGRIVEAAPARGLFAAPRHPYTAGLLASLPTLDLGESAGSRRRLKEIPGSVPDPWHLPVGCKFQDRCAGVKDMCRQSEPALVAFAADRAVRCHFPLESGLA